jgi:AcrR family transcriptional regulator
MARLSREESRALTRARLLDAARTLFARDGYGSTSVDRIADEAGYSKGAVYSNFSGKEEIFLEVLEEHGRTSLERLLSSIDTAADAVGAIEMIGTWADDISRSGNWTLLILEHARHARQNDAFSKAQEDLFRSHWRQLGSRLLTLFPTSVAGGDPELLGALVFELAYAPAMTFVRTPTSGALIRLALNGLLAQSAVEKP